MPCSTFYLILRPLCSRLAKYFYIHPTLTLQIFYQEFVRITYPHFHLLIPLHLHLQHLLSLHLLILRLHPIRIPAMFHLNYHPQFFIIYHSVFLFQQIFVYPVSNYFFKIAQVLILSEHIFKHIP